MAFVPKLSICFETCNLIKFVDTTNVYHATNNTEGWGEGNAAEGADVDTAIITLYDSDDAVVFSYDVSTQIPNPVIGDIIFTDYEYALEDGEYTLEYVVTFDDTSSYTFSEKIENSCNFECCIDTLIATIPEKLCEEKCNTDYIDEVLLVEGLLYAYLCAAACEKTQLKAEINKRLDRLCDFQCNCN